MLSPAPTSVRSISDWMLTHEFWRAKMPVCWTMPVNIGAFVYPLSFMSNRLQPSEAEWDDWTGEVLDFMKSPKTEQGLPCEIPEAPLSGGLTRILPILGHGFEQAVPTDQPGFMAYVPGGGIPSAALANFLGNLANRFTGIEEQAPFLVSLEKQVITWLCREVGLPSTAFGILTSGGSMANLTAVICARVHVLGDTGDFSKARLYVS